VQGRTGQPGSWRLPGGPVGAPAWWAATSNVEGGSETEEGPLFKEGGLSSDKLFAGVPEFLVTPLLMGPVRLISRGRFEEPVPWPCVIRCRPIRFAALSGATINADKPTY